MSLNSCALFYVFILFGSVTRIIGGIRSNNHDVRIQQLSIDNYDNREYYYSRYYLQSRENVQEKVNIQLYYECLCGDCINFDTTQFRQVVLQMSNYLNIQTYPYGNAETTERNGKYVFRCQHGPKECYGNKLHACALDIIKNQTTALLFNSCMMKGGDSRGSDDAAAEQCGTSMNIDPEPIKTCAKGEMGTKLLKHYGDESKKANFHYVPYILLNGKESDGSDFMREVCAAYANPPPPCASFAA